MVSRDRESPQPGGSGTTMQVAQFTAKQCTNHLGGACWVLFFPSPFFADPSQHKHDTYQTGLCKAAFCGKGAAVGLAQSILRGSGWLRLQCCNYPFYSMWPWVDQQGSETDKIRISAYARDSFLWDAPTVLFLAGLLSGSLPYFR